MPDILRNTGKTIFKKQNPEAKSRLPLQSGERDRHLPSRMHPAELLAADLMLGRPALPQGLGELKQRGCSFFLDSTVRVEESHLRGCWQAGGWILQSEKSICVWKSPHMQNQTWLLLKASWLKWVCCYALRGPGLHSSRTHNSWYCQRGVQECGLRGL